MVAVVLMAGAVALFAVVRSRGRRDRKVAQRAGETQTWAISHEARFPRFPSGRRGRRRGLR